MICRRRLSREKNSYFFRVVKSPKFYKFIVIFFIMLDLTHKIINPGLNDYHCHSAELSDGFDTNIAYLVEQAGKMRMTELAITDHSQATISACGWTSTKSRKWLERWRNTVNKVNIIFGIEGDLINEDGEICDYVINHYHQTKIGANFLILSSHEKTYQGDPKKITSAYLQAIQHRHKDIRLIGHPDSNATITEHLDLNPIIQAANDYGIPLEINCANLHSGKSKLDRLRQVIETADKLYINSDAHTRYEFETLRDEGFKTLAELGFMIRRTPQLELGF